jgi:hypothetical protein
LDGVKDRAVEDGKADFGGLMSDGRDQMCLTDPGWAQKEDVGSLANEVSGGQLHDLTSFDRGIEGEVEIL